jgi:hypothetical protein
MNAKIWGPIKDAPRDGRLLILLVDNSDGGEDRVTNPLEDARYTRTIGHNSYEYDGLDEWKYAGWDWDLDTYADGKRATPVLFAELPETPDEFRDPWLRGKDEGRDEI